MSDSETGPAAAAVSEQSSSDGLNHITSVRTQSTLHSLILSNDGLPHSSFTFCLMQNFLFLFIWFLSVTDCRTSHNK